MGRPSDQPSLTASSYTPSGVSSVSKRVEPDARSCANVPPLIPGSWLAPEAHGPAQDSPGTQSEKGARTQPSLAAIPGASWATISPKACCATASIASLETYLGQLGPLAGQPWARRPSRCPSWETLARLTNRSVTRTVEGMPFSMRFMLSWTLHAVRDPQLARPTTARSALSTTSSNTSWGGGEAMGTCT